ncbi:MAG: hypothetical protein M3Q65_05405, partial [Chloroflexota bacterium]|nr:hypothetical protein [Chloroflexota bacterium]
KDWLRQQELGRDLLRRKQDVIDVNLPGTGLDQTAGLELVASALTALDAAQDAFDYSKRALTGAGTAGGGAMLPALHTPR